MDALKSAPTEKTKIKLTLKNPQGPRKPDVSKVEPKKRPATSPPANDPKAKKATSRREELLKQLKAVEDAIAKKRSKVWESAQFEFFKQSVHRITLVWHKKIIF